MDVRGTQVRMFFLFKHQHGISIDSEGLGLSGISRFPDIWESGMIHDRIFSHVSNRSSVFPFLAAMEWYLNDRVARMCSYCSLRWSILLFLASLECLLISRFARTCSHVSCCSNVFPSLASLVCFPFLVSPECVLISRFARMCSNCVERVLSHVSLHSNAFLFLASLEGVFLSRFVR